MTDFAPNQSSIAPEPSYQVQTKAKLKRVALASFLCAIAACITVSLIGLVILFIYTQLMSVIAPGSNFPSSGLLSGAGMAVLMAALNWYFGYITIPAAWLFLGLSLGRFPRRKIVSAKPYYKWGAIWGAVLVGATTAIAAGFLIDAQITAIIGALITGSLIGGLSGLVCGWLFLAIVRPAEQVRQIEVDVF